jgi:hypothetical protein
LDGLPQGKPTRRITRYSTKAELKGMIEPVYIFSAWKHYFTVDKSYLAEFRLGLSPEA